MFTVSYDAPLMHHGVKGMKWGVRRYQNRDGSLTSAGRAHYGKSGSGSGRSVGGGRASGSRRGGKKPLTAAQKAERKRKLIKGAKIAAAALGTAAVVGGTAYAVNRYRQGQRAKLLENPSPRSNPGTSRGMHINTSSMRDDTRAGRTINGYRVQERPGASAGREHSAAVGGFKTGSNKGSYNPTTGEYKGVYDSRIPTHTNSPKGSYETSWSSRARNINNAAAKAARNDDAVRYRPKTLKSRADQQARNIKERTAAELRGASYQARTAATNEYRRRSESGGHRSVGSPYSRNGYSEGAIVSNARARLGAALNDDAVMYRPSSSSRDRVQAANAHAQASTARARKELEKYRRRYG